MTEVSRDGAVGAGFTLREKGEKLAKNLGLDTGHTGNVGIGSNCLFVYIRGVWRGEKMATFEGVPVVWREKMGTARALAG